MDLIIPWLLEGDAAIRYQTYRDLADQESPDLRAAIGSSGWGRELLARRHPEGFWGRGFYAPKWTCSHYTLLDLRHLEYPKDDPRIGHSIDLILDSAMGADGGLNPARTIPGSDVCVSGMFLNYATFFGMPETKLHGLIDFIITQQLPDGGFNCAFNQGGAHHSSLHSTLSVAEGLCEWRRQGYSYRQAELRTVEIQAREFMLCHRLFRSDHSGAIIHPQFLRFTFPFRWRYTLLRALDYWRHAGHPYDPRLQEALAIVAHKRGRDGRWKLQAKFPGQEHFAMETVGQPSRWLSLIALRVLRHFGSAG